MTLPLCSTGMGRRKSVATGVVLDFQVMIGCRSWCRPGKEPSTFVFRIVWANQRRESELWVEAKRVRH